MKTVTTLLMLLALLFTASIARADSFSISGNAYAGSDQMGFSVTSLLNGGSHWRSAAPIGPGIVGDSILGVKTTLEFSAQAWQGPGYAEATGPWGTTTNLGGQIRVSTTFLFNSSLTSGAVKITVPAIVVDSLQAYDDNHNLLGTLNFKRWGLVTLQGEINGLGVIWDYGEVEFPMTVVPEPGTLLLVGTGVLGILRAVKSGSRAS